MAIENIVASIKKQNLKNLILASASPRRAELIKKVQERIGGLRVSIEPSKVEETVLEGELPETYAVRIAAEKAEEVYSRFGGGFTVLGCDTAVALDGKIFGKPRDGKDAERTFRLLCGRTHEVITGICLIFGGEKPKKMTEFEKTYVTFGAFDAEIVYNYIQSGLGADKAGGYGLQDAALAPLILSVEGDRDNVIGLPVGRVARILSEGTV